MYFDENWSNLCRESTFYLKNSPAALNAPILHTNNEPLEKREQKCKIQINELCFHKIIKIYNQMYNLQNDTQSKCKHDCIDI